MAGKGTGGGTSFEDMSHEEMLAWLDQANAGEVQAAADRLTAAATEIRKIAEELKVRPQWVEWKGEGADAFRAWANDLANSTHRLGDFSENSAKWLSEASNAIATAQASIPRDTKGAQANLDAAEKYHNDPDSAAIGSKAASDLAALKADREKVRQEAAAQMTKLGQSYEVSATQLNGLQRPKFPPPPNAIRPPTYGSSEDIARPGGGATGGAEGSRGFSSAPAGSSRTEHRDVVTSGFSSQTPRSGSSSSLHLRPTTIEPSTHVGIDSVSAPPEVHPPSTSPTVGSLGITRPDAGTPLPMNGPVPLPGSPVRLPSTSGGFERPVGGGRVPIQPGEEPIGPAPGRGVTGVGPAPGRNLPSPGGALGRAIPTQSPTAGRGAPAGTGITGGRPVGPSTTGRSMGRMPSASVGGQPVTRGGSIGRPPVTGATGQSVTRTPESIPGPATATPRDGIVGGTPQRAARPQTRPGAPVPSAPTRGGISGGLPSETDGRRRGERGAPNGSIRRTRQRNEKQRTEHPNEPPASD
jgi:uncharacterized protein YukE